MYIYDITVWLDHNVRLHTRVQADNKSNVFAMYPDKRIRFNSIKLSERGKAVQGLANTTTLAV